MRGQALGNPSLNSLILMAEEEQPVIIAEPGEMLSRSESPSQDDVAPFDSHSHVMSLIDSSISFRLDMCYSIPRQLHSQPDNKLTR